MEMRPLIRAESSHVFLKACKHHLSVFSLVMIFEILGEQVTWILTLSSLAALRSRKAVLHRVASPLVHLICKQKTSAIAALYIFLFKHVDAGQGSDPEWNEHFVFTVSEGVTELTLKIMDSDIGADDVVGEAT